MAPLLGMRVIGLTGNIAAGKSSVARLFTQWGVPVVDADALARDAVAPGEPALDAIVARWGRGILRDDGTLDRAALRRIVFADDAERIALEAIVHPEVTRFRRAAVEAARARGEAMIVCDIPLLFEANLTGEVDAIIVVDAPHATRVARLMRDRGMSAAEAGAVIAAQWPIERKRGRADYIIENDGSPAELEARSRDVFNALRARNVSP